MAILIDKLVIIHCDGFGCHNHLPEYRVFGKELGVEFELFVESQIKANNWTSVPVGSVKLYYCPNCIFY